MAPALGMWSLRGGLLCLLRGGNHSGKDRVQRLCSAQRLVSAHSEKWGLHRRPGAAGWNCGW